MSIRAIIAAWLRLSLWMHTAYLCYFTSLSVEIMDNWEGVSRILESWMIPLFEQPSWRGVFISTGKRVLIYSCL
ncbi:hypothetical protein BDW62DRAFT_9866 [Aspergillus aurantiobrunneus]